LILGLADDAKAFSPGPKFALQLTAATMVVASGLRAPFTGLPAADGVLSVAYILTFLNAFNFTDVCDGLLAVVAIAFFSFLAFHNRDVAVFALGIVGAIAGFLVFNRPPASVFMGDAGSHLLGFLASGLLLAGANEADVVVTAEAGVIAAGVPMFETAFITVVRVMKDLPWWRGSPDHFSLRLQAAGLSATAVGFCSLAASLVLGVCATVFVRSSCSGRLVLCGALLLVASSFAVWLLSLERAQVRREEGS
jgi:UDP-GlcNAc:undecaprenyl-phosphate GlcNAc-1-phosphate transferase